MKVLALRADNGGCAKYRIEEPIKAIQKKYDWDIRIDHDVNIDGTKIVDTGEYIIDEVKEDVDLIVVQRPLNRSFNAVIQQAQKQGIAVVVELDDDFQEVHPKNAAWKSVHPSFSPEANYEWLTKTASLADWVTVSTPSLTKYAPHGRYSILRNCVSEDAFDLKASPHSQRGVGWSGTIQTHPGDLETTKGGISKALSKHSEDFHVVGDRTNVIGALGLTRGTLVHATGWMPISEYYKALIDNISIGVVPLEASAFNEAKSFLKGLEMAALGIPFIASPTSEYKLLSEKYGIGIIASTPEEWTKHLSTLLTNPKKAYMLGNKYRKLVKNTFTYDTYADDWAAAWQQAVAYRKSQ